MNPSGRHRSARDRPAKAPLSEDAVVDAAQAILKAAKNAARRGSERDRAPKALSCAVAEPIGEEE